MPTWTAERTTVNQHIAVGAELDRIGYQGRLYQAVRDVQL